MRDNLKINSLLVSGLAIFFWWAFGFAKHDPVLRNIIPFGEDPYDAVSSFAAIAAILLAFVSLARAFFPRIAGRSGRPIYVLRAQIAIPMCILVTLIAEAVAMGRHTSLWMEAPGRNKLLFLLPAQTILSLTTLTLFRRSEPGAPLRVVRAAAIVLGMEAILAVYPERLILKIPGHLLTVLFGDALLFTSVSILVKAWLPDMPRPERSKDAVVKKHLRIVPIGAATLIGAFVGAAACISELGETDISGALTHILFVGSVYIGLGGAGLLIGYISLGRLLGFVIDEPDVQ